MEIKQIEQREGLVDNAKALRAIDKMQKLLEAISKKEIPEEALSTINTHITALNTFVGEDKELLKHFKKTYGKILKLLNQELRLVAKHHYRSRWMVVGMLTGMVASSVFNNTQLLAMGNASGIGLSIGMFVGLLVGTSLDQRAQKEGRLLDI